MAKRSGKSEERENKSQAIRDFIAQHGDPGPKAIAEALNQAHGWSISAAYVSTIKNKMGGKPATKRRVREPARGGLDEGALLQAKKLMVQTGGISQAKAALDLIDRLTS